MNEQVVSGWLVSRTHRSMARSDRNVMLLVPGCSIDPVSLLSSIAQFIKSPEHPSSLNFPAHRRERAEEPAAHEPRQVHSKLCTAGSIEPWHMMGIQGFQIRGQC